MENGPWLLQALRDLKTSSHSVRAEWSHADPGGEPGAVDCLTENLSIYSRNDGTQWSVVVALGSLGLVFPASMVPGVRHENDVHFEVHDNDVSFELRDGELMHTRRLVFS